jgi:hypothetical protein
MSEPRSAASLVSFRSSATTLPVLVRVHLHGMGMEEEETAQFLDLLCNPLMSTRASNNQLRGWRHLHLNLAALKKQRLAVAAAEDVCFHKSNFFLV